MSYLYVIGPKDGNVKIGYSQDPHNRLLQLQTGHDQELFLYYMKEGEPSRIPLMEKIVHRLLRHKRIHGEWFTISAEEARWEIDHAFIRYGDIKNLKSVLV